MGSSFKVAPGVRIRASSRGIRTSVGPRAARVHVGAGRPGFSSGAGPVSFYTSLGGGRRGGGRSGSRAPSMASYQRQLAAAEKAEEAQRLAAAFREILNVHGPSSLPLVRLWPLRRRCRMRGRCADAMSARRWPASASCNEQRGPRLRTALLGPRRRSWWQPANRPSSSRPRYSVNSTSTGSGCATTTRGGPGHPRGGL
jgi:hypothetical protein